MRFVVYEVWTCNYIVEAESEDEVYENELHGPNVVDMSLCNWHVVAIPEPIASGRARTVARIASPPSPRRKPHSSSSPLQRGDR